MVIPTELNQKPMRISDINPKKSPAFSPNLFRWMKWHCHELSSGGVSDTVYRVKANTPLAEHYGVGTLFIGSPYNQYEGDADFSGERLIAVLCNGKSAGSFCFPGAMKSLEEVKDFWSQYLKIGRCAIDPEHQENFYRADRYRLIDDIRECLWCGEKHRAVSKTTTSSMIVFERLLVNDTIGSKS